MLVPRLALLCSVAGLVAAAPYEFRRQASSITVPPSSVASPSASPSASITTDAVETAVPSPSAALDTPLLTNYSAPGEQPWCEGVEGGQIFCPGRILQTVQLAGLYPDSKTFVDKPTTASEAEVVSAFDALIQNNATIQGLVGFVEQYFSGEGLDLLPATLEDFIEQPAFLENIANPILRGWMQIVHGYWQGLAKTSDTNSSCTECVSTLIELPNTFIVPGGRFRENYYWDTYWALVGLLTGGLQTTANQTIQNYLYLIEEIGFIPNGARTYYLNRSQPPLFTQMLHLYVTSTNDTSYLERALSLVEVELAWWDTNRSVSVTSPSGQNHSVFIYDVDTTAPRPESYLEDWEAVNGIPGGQALNLSTDLYKELSSGAESGMDYSAARWSSDPLENPDDFLATFRTLTVTQIVPIDLNSILYRNYILLVELYDLQGNSSRAGYWTDRASTLREAILDLHWDSEVMLFKEFNRTSGEQLDVWSTTAYYPYWSGIIPDEVLNSTEAAQKAFSGLGFITSNYNGSIPTTMLRTGQQWDFPNVWPPQVWIAMKALQSLPANISSASFSNYSQEVLSFNYLPPGHLGNITDESLPQQTRLGANLPNITSVPTFDALGNVGNVTNDEGLGWRDGLLFAVANRYMSSAFCSWYSTGGSVPGLLNRLPDEQLDNPSDDGNMFEKFSVTDIDQAGAGGEYEVQSGFAWTNGVAVWIASNLGGQLNRPTCPAFADEQAAGQTQSMVRQLALRPKLAAFIAKRHDQRRA